jgi:hypothetical protein
LIGFTDLFATCHRANTKFDLGRRASVASLDQDNPTPHPAHCHHHGTATDDPPKHRCGPAEIAKDTTIAVGGAAGIGSGIAGEIPTLGAATAAILAGIGALWDGMDKLGECQ